jgi:hypothetical protein
VVVETRPSPLRPRGNPVAALRDLVIGPKTRNLRSTSITRSIRSTRRRRSTGSITRRGAVTGRSVGAARSTESIGSTVTGSTGGIASIVSKEVLVVAEARTDIRALMPKLSHRLHKTLKLRTEVASQHIRAGIRHKATLAGMKKASVESTRLNLLGCQSSQCLPQPNRMPRSSADSLTYVSI